MHDRIGPLADCVPLLETYPAAAERCARQTSADGA